ncbi:MerR family transcriptional regulator [Naumannella halotolerans]|uniref:MerR-like DNA binding protein n=1 Tax=Naumannella halotolerans TaxID=993414 RepID=A0A4R7J1J5_9ACTN|nr:MerR family transcriptional regulator [Naumannella halotolerans]TDT31021.1 MerR-like DNA binding protein [Naumannella halotolerans]
MRVAELSELSNVSVASIKFYAREGLLAGNRVGYNQTEYGPEHIVRLRLIKALINVAGLSIASVRRVLEAVDDEQVGVEEVLERAHEAVAPTNLPAVGEETLQRVRELFDELGWNVPEDSVGFRQTAAVISQYEQIGRADLSERASRYGPPVMDIARGDMEAVAQTQDRNTIAQTVVIGTILGDSMLSAMRKAAREHLSDAS